MTEQNEKPVRVQFPKDYTARQIADAIRKMQDDWAKKYPERAHRLYPKIFDKDGNRIRGNDT